MTENAEVLGAVQFFSLLNPEDLESLVGQVHEKKLDQGEILFHAGEPGDSLYVVKSGAVELYVKDTAGQKIVLRAARAGDLFGERTNDQLAQADATLTTLFSGRDFGEEILGAIEPGVQLIVASQQFDAATSPVPQIKLPAFALVTTLRQPDEMQPQLKRIFTSLIGFTNITGAMNHHPQLDVETIKEPDATFVFATYAADIDRPENWKVPIQFNFSPTLALVGDRAVVASTGAIARAIVTGLRDESDATARPGTPDSSNPNTLVMVDAEQAGDALSANRDQLVSQNMIEKGHSREEAEKEIDTLLHLLDLLESLEIRFEVGDSARLTAVLRVKS